MFPIAAIALTVAVTVPVTSYASDVNEPPSYYQRETYRRASYTDNLIAIFAAECSSPPPCPVALASLPMLVLPPPEADRSVTWLTHTQGASRGRRPLRNSVEKKDDNR